MDIKLENVACNLCGLNDTTPLFTQRDLSANDEIEFSVVECTNCGLTYISPRPAQGDIHLFYPENFFSYQLEAVPPENPSLRRRLISKIANSSASQKVKTVQKLVKPEPNFEVLDVAPGKGAFLYALKHQVGCEVTGLDFDAKSVKYCRQKLGLNVSEGGAHDVDKLGKQFDLVTMWHFLEHDFDPAAALKSVNRVLKPDQYLLLEVPNAQSLENAIFGKRSFLYDIPRHLYNFSPTTITRQLEEAGFTVESVRFPHFSGGWIGTIQGLFCKGKVYADLESNIFLFMLLSMLCLPADLLCSLLGRGSVMTVLARKVGEPA